MIMKLYQLIVSREKGLQKGNFLGSILLQNGKTSVEISEPALKQKIEEFFSKPLAAHDTDQPGNATRLKHIPPHTPEFFREAFYELRNVYRLYPEIEE